MTVWDGKLLKENELSKPAKVIVGVAIVVVIAFAMKAAARNVADEVVVRPWALGIVMLVSLFMNFYQLGQNGFGNLYYAAGVRSMLDSWHNFFFVSFDPGGFVTIDKPPLGFWLQVLSARLFGFTAFSVYLPQALAGVLSVIPAALWFPRDKLWQEGVGLVGVSIATKIGANVFHEFFGHPTITFARK